MIKKMYELKKAKHKSKSIEVAERMMPIIYLSSKDYPEIKDWEVGETYKLVLEVKQKSKSEREDDISAEFEIVKIGEYKKDTKDVVDSKKEIKSKYLS